MQQVIRDLSDVWNAIGTERFLILILGYVIYRLWVCLDECQRKYIALLERVTAVVEQNTQLSKVMEMIDELSSRSGVDVDRKG